MPLNYKFFRAQVSVAATHNLSEAAKLTISSHFGLAGVPETANKLMNFFSFFKVFLDSVLDSNMGNKFDRK